MKIEELKECFDSVTPTKEQRDKMLAGIMRAKEEPVKIVKLNRYKYFSVAAVIALGVFVAVYSYVGRDFVPQIKTENVVKNTGVSTYATVDDKQNKVAASVDTTDKTLDVTSADIPNKTDNNTSVDASYYEVKEKATNVQNKDVVTDFSTGETAKNTQKETITEKMLEVYPELEDETVADTPSVAMYDAGNSVRTVPAPESVEEDYEVDEEYSGGAGGVGGGGSAGGGASSNKNISLNYIKNHSEYSALFPTYFPQNFVFESAEQYAYNSNGFVVFFTSVDGGVINIEFVKKQKDLYVEDVITLDQLKNMDNKGYIDFTLDCGDYLIKYFAKNVVTDELYKMVKSSQCFNN